MIYAGLLSVVGLGLEDAHVPCFWFLLSYFRSQGENFKLSWITCKVLLNKFERLIPWLQNGGSSAIVGLGPQNPYHIWCLELIPYWHPNRTLLVWDGSHAQRLQAGTCIVYTYGPKRNYRIRTSGLCMLCYMGTRHF